MILGLQKIYGPSYPRHLHGARHFQVWPSGKLLGVNKGKRIDIYIIGIIDIINVINQG